MAKSSIAIAESLARLSASTIFELRGEWRRLHRAPPPMRLSRELLMRAITYKLQERPLGGLSKSIIRKLERLNLDSEACDAQKPAPPDLCMCVFEILFDRPDVLFPRRRAAAVEIEIRTEIDG